MRSLKTLSLEALRRGLPTIALCLTGAFACTDSRESTDAVFDLAARFAEARVESESSVFSLGTPGAEPELAGGWSFAERDRGRDRSFRWGLRPESELAFWVSWPRDLALVLEGTPAPDDRAPRDFEVVLNGVTLGRFDVAGGLTEYAISIPAAALVRGHNPLRIVYDPGNPVQPPAGRYRRPNLALAWYGATLKGLEQGAEPAADGGGRLFMPFGSRVQYVFKTPKDAALRVERWRFTGDRSGSLEIHRRLDGSEDQHLATLHPEEALEAPLLVEAGEVVRLTMTAVAASAPSGQSDEGIVVEKPAIWGSLTRGDEVPGTEAANGASRPNIVVYLVDTLRADRLSCYGHSRAVSPAIDRFAAGATLFENARAQASWTLASVASLFTGVWPPAHGVVYPNVALTQEAVTLAEVLQSAGYSTSAISANGFVSEKFGLEQGFRDHLVLEAGRRDAERLLAETISWVDSRDPTKPFFLYLHSLDPHQPYLPKEPFKSRFAAQADEMYERIQAMPAKFNWDPTESVRHQLLMLYDALIAQNDAAFGKTLDYLDQQNLLDDALVVFVSDHGEEFYEHRSWTHGANLFAETLNVPLIVKLPGQRVGRRVQRLAQHIDLLPTLLDYLGLAPMETAGRSLLPELLGTSLDGYAPPVFGHTFRNKKENRSVIDDGWKFMERVVPGAGSEILVNWEEDPGDSRDLRAEHPIRSEYLRGLLRRQLETSRLPPAEEAVLDAATRDDLRALGYLD